ncbi:MAG: biopolymer transporter ExbD [Thermodesulfobacteria bacterium]|nr:biopolymer transporter ExbD [Thermodesulfobacteriota bacterium]
MGMSSNGNKRLLSDINVTPLVDVMLVLLIIFMVTAPMMTRGLDVKLPETTAKVLPQKKVHSEITITAKGDIYLGEEPVDPDTLKKELAAMKQKGKVAQILLRADQDVPYKVVVRVMAAVKEAGIDNLGLVTAPEQVTPPVKK